MALLIAFVSFIMAAGIFVLFWLSFGAESGQQVVRQRMEEVQRVERRGKISQGVQLVRDELMSGVPLFDRMMMRWAWAVRFRDFVSQAGMKTRPDKIILTGGALACLGFGLAELFHARFPLAILVAAATSVIPFVYVAIKRRRRLQPFRGALPRSSGFAESCHSSGTCVYNWSGNDCQRASGTDRRGVPHDIRGTKFWTAVAGRVAEPGRPRSSDRRAVLRYSTADSEGNGRKSRGILENLSHVIRDRFRIYRDVRTKSAHGRLTAGILIALPPLVAFALGIVNPSYLPVLYHDRIGPLILWGAAIWQIIGSVLLWKVIHIEI